MANSTRRDFLKTSTAAAGVVAALGGSVKPALAGKRSAVDMVPLGNSGVKVTRLAFGTGTNGGRIQRELGQAEFTKLVRHAYDRGIRFFETAESYREMHGMLGEALKGIPRDSYKLMTKMRAKKDISEVPVAFDQFRKELNTDYFDILLIHCVRTAGWADQLAWQRDAFSEMKEKKVILSKGASCHGIMPLRDFPTTEWLDVSLNRINHNGAKMDNVRNDNKQPGDVPEVLSHLKQIHANGTGVLGMKSHGRGAVHQRPKTGKSRSSSF